MSRIIAFARRAPAGIRRLSDGAILRALIVCSCSLALILAKVALPL